MGSERNNDSVSKRVLTEVMLMKIIKNGRKDYDNPEYLIKCPTCGCEFSVTRNEMVIVGQQYNELIYLHPCPECRSRCYAREGNRRILN